MYECQGPTPRDSYVAGLGVQPKCRGGVGHSGISSTQPHASESDSSYKQQLDGDCDGPEGTCSV